MFEFLHVSDTTLFTSATLWLGFLVVLFGLTRTISQGLAWLFLVAGVAVPIVLAQTSTEGMAGTCFGTDKVQTYFSDDARYKFAIIERNCLNPEKPQFEVRIGKGNDLGPLQTVFMGDAANRPVSVQQKDENEFVVELAAVEAGQGQDDTAKSVTVRLDSDTGQPADMFDYRQSAS